MRRTLLLVLLSAAAPALAQSLPQATCTPGGSAPCPVESVKVDLGGTTRVHALAACTLRSDGRVTACHPVCSLGASLDEALTQQLEQRRYQPASDPGRAAASSYVFMVEAQVPAGTRCTPVPDTTRERAEQAPAGGPLLPTCRRLETDRCVAEKLEVQDRELPYPADVLRRGVQGSVSVNCVLRASGHIEDCAAQAPVLPPGAPRVELGPAVPKYLEQRRYQPVTLEGKAVEVHYAFFVTVRAAPGSDFARAERPLRLRVVKDVRARLHAAPVKRDRSTPICVGGSVEGLTAEDLRRLGRELTLTEDCRSVKDARRYIALEAPQRAWTGEIILGAAGGWMDSHGADYVYRATTKPLSIQLTGSSEYEH